MNIRNKGWLFVFTLLICGMLVATGIEAKKPPKPDEPDETTAEWVVFTEDLMGEALVEGCCPNAGPFPEYTMTLSFALGDFPAYTPIDGELFINNYRIGKDRGYVVQFWNDHEADNHVAIEIKGGEVYSDKKTKIVTVVFTDAECRDLHEPKDLITYVDFTLVRTPD